MEITGKVIINVRDAKTMEIVETIEQSNVITKTFNYCRYNNNGVSGFDIFISPSTTASYEDWPLVTGCITTGYVPVGVTSPTQFPDADPAYIQLMRRFDAPTVTRSISTIGLYHATFSTAIGHSDGTISRILNAYVKLSSPCIQTNTQILDVYYRIQVSNSNVKNFNNVTMPARNYLSYLYSTTNQILANITAPTYANVLANSNTAPTDSGNLLQVGLTHQLNSTNYGFGVGWDTIYGNHHASWSLTTTQQIGVVFGSLISMISASNSYGFPAVTGRNITAPNGSKIQPIFSHAASTLTDSNATHMLDVLPATGSGTYNMGGTWTTGNLPELYKISIVTGGAVGTATYIFAKRNHVGFQGQYYNTDCQSLAGAYNIINSTFSTKKKHTCTNQTGSYTKTGAYGSRMEKYDTTHFISYDTTGVSRYNITNHFVEMWDSTTTPALPATNLRQACVKTSDGSIWAACANTGIYQISADGLTVTHYTTSNGLPSNFCRAIDIGRNNTVWAYTDGGMVSSADGGATWTVYNAGTPTVFNSTILTAEPSAVWYMRVDPKHANDRMCIVRSADAATNAAVGMIWWERSTGVVTNANGPIWGTLSDQQRTYRRLPSMFNVSDNTSFWAMASTDGNGYVTITALSYGYTSLITCVNNSSAAGYTSGNILFVRDSANTQDLLLYLIHSNTWNAEATTASLMGMAYQYYDTWQTPVTYLYNSAGVIVLQDNGSPTTHYPRTVPVGYAIYQVQTCVYLGQGVLVGYSSEGFTGTNHNQYGWITTLYGNGTPTGGPLEYLIWEKYGWDGANWVLGNTNPKTTHVGEEPLIHGLTSRFTNGVVGTSFVASEYYTNSVNDGILKNNAMTASSWYSQYLNPTEYLTSFDGVIRLYPWTTGLVVWRKASASITINNDGSLTNLQYRSYKLTACSKQRVFGNFSISGTIPFNTVNQYTIGIKSDFIMEYTVLRENQYATWGINVSGATVTIKNSSNVNSGTATTISSTATWNITRVSNTITFYINGVAKHTTTDASYSFIIHARFTDSSNTPNIFTIMPVTVNSSGSGYYTGMGDSTYGNGIYDTKQLATFITNTSDLSINGTPLTVCNTTTATPPATGGVSYSQEEGILLFHSDDADKTVTGGYLTIYQSSTPCNIPPVL
jgi:hypothetical protein